MAEAGAQLLSDAVLELACFEVEGQLFGIDVLQIREIVRPPSLTPLPKAPSLIEGVIDLRGAVVPVVDLGRAMGGDPVPETPAARIAVLEVDGMVLGLRVASAVDVLPVGVDFLEEPPALATEAGYGAVRAVVRREAGPPVMVISLPELRRAVQASASEEAS